MISRTIILYVVLNTLFCTTIYSSPFNTSDPVSVPDDSLKVGLVLSGGGAKGVAHIGVIKRLEEAGVRIDYITGTSMGSLIGAFYSIGYTSTQLTEIGNSTNWDQLFSEKPSRLFISNYERMFDDRTIASFPISERGLDLPFGIVGGQNINSFLSRYTWPVHGTEKFENFPIPYATVATELSSGEPVIFDSGYLPDAIRASISIPSLFRPHRINGVEYIDGGVSNNLPVNVAREMGANYIISVNVSSPVFPSDSLNTFTEVLNQVVNYRINEKIEASIKDSDIYISPEKILEYEVLDFEKVNELIEIGYQEADKYSAEFEELARRQQSPPPLRNGIGEFGSLPFNKVVIEGNEVVSDEFILNELQLDDSFLLTPDFIDDKISQLYSTQLFDLITYRVQPDEDYYYNLHIQVIENRSDVFKAGLRYETQTNASILLATSFRNFPFNGTSSRFDLRLGDEVRAQGDILTYGTLGSRLGILTSVLFESENIDRFKDRERTARFKNNLTRFEFSAGNYLSSRYLVAAGIRRDFIRQTNTINADIIRSSEVDHQSTFIRFMNDQLHRRYYPSNGTRLILEGTYSGEFTLSNLNYLKIGGLFEYYIPLSEDVSFRNLFYGGYSSGEELPWSAWFSPNRKDPLYGYVRFGGFERYELSTRNMQMMSAGFQFEPLYHRFLNIDYYVGRFLNEWNLSTDQIIHGASLSVGALTIIGPINIILSSSTENRFLAEIQIGYQF
ncbi:MAG: patatin-like phospholipase family protein [Balneolaceae bacterium]